MQASTTSQFKLSRRREIRSVGNRPAQLAAGGLVLLAVGLLASGWTSFGMERLMHAYLLAVSFFLSISLGALFFVLLQHLTGARWSVVVRRVAEIVSMTLPVVALLMVPVVLPLLWGNAWLYPWNDATQVAGDKLLEGKAAYLNAPFFVIRSGVYLLVWTLIARFYYRGSQAQDENPGGDEAARMTRWSGPAMIAYAITVNFAAFDWIMTLDPHWFSTIFGIYFFAGCSVAVFAVLPIMTVLLQRYGLLMREITTEHYHEFGKLLFGFTFFWAYIAFSQYLLIWYANIPEETIWYLHRQHGGWQFVGWVLVVGHFVLPFLGLMSRSVRRNRKLLVAWAVFMLGMHWVDLLWMIMPQALPEVSGVGLVELLCLVGTGALWAAGLLRHASGTQLVPVGDAHLRQSVLFHTA
jgi:hypothetical protein